MATSQRCVRSHLAAINHAQPKFSHIHTRLLPSIYFPALGFFYHSPSVLNPLTWANSSFAPPCIANCRAFSYSFNSRPYDCFIFWISMSVHYIPQRLQASGHPGYLHLLCGAGRVHPYRSLIKLKHFLTISWPCGMFFWPSLELNNFTSFIFTVVEKHDAV